MSLTGELLPDEAQPLTGNLEPVSPTAPLTGALGTSGDAEMLTGGLQPNITPAELTGELQEVGGPPLDIAGLLSLVESATDEERALLKAALDISEVGAPGLVNLSFRPGLTYTTADYAGDSPRLPVRYAGVELTGEVGQITQAIVFLRPQYVQGGETVSIITASSFDGMTFLADTASVVLTPGQSNLIIPISFTATFGLFVLLGTDDGDPRMFRASDVSPYAPAAAKCVFYDGTLQDWTGVLTETTEPYMRVFQLDRPAEDKGVNGPADPMDVHFWGETRPAEPAAGMIFGDLSIGKVIWFHPYSYTWVNLDGTPLE